MGMKTFDDVGNVGFSKSWRDEVKDLLLEFKAGDVRAVRFLDSFLPIVMHWVPFISKQGGRIRFFPQMCLRWDLETSAINDEAECPACDRDIFPTEGGVFWVLDVDALYLGDKNRALRILDLGSRERQKLGSLSKFNKVQGVPYNVAHSKFGRIVQVSFDPNNQDKSLRWLFSNHDRLPVRILSEGTQLQVKIPESADSEFVGKVFKFELQDLMELVFAPSLSDSKDKFRRMKVDDALKRLKADDKEEEDEEESGSRRSRRTSSPRTRRRNEDEDDETRSRRSRRKPQDDDPEDDEEPRSRRSRRKPQDEDEDDEPRSRRSRRKPQDEDEDDEPRSRRSRRKQKPQDDDPEDDEELRSRRSRRKPQDDDPEEDFGDDDDFEDENQDDEDEEEVEEKPRKRGPRDKKNRRTRSKKHEDDDEDDEDKDPCNQKASKGPKCVLHKQCFGRIGDEDTEDCTLCVHKDDCMDLNAADED